MCSDSYTPAIVRADDSPGKVQGGFRAERQEDYGIVTVSGEVYDGDSDFTRFKLSGGNVVGCWSHAMGDQTFRVRACFDRSKLEHYDPYGQARRPSVSSCAKNACVFSSTISARPKIS